MKIKAAPTVKGKLNIAGLYSGLLPGAEADVDESVFNSYQVQMLLMSGVLTSDEYKKSSLIEYRNKGKTKLHLPYGWSVLPNQVFYIEKSRESDNAIKNLVINGVIEKTNGKPLVEKPVEKKKEEPTKKTISKKATKAEDSKAPKSVKEVMENQKIPKGMHIHDPAKNKEEKVISFVEEKLAEIKKQESEGFDFADTKQLKERLEKTQKSIEAKKNTQ